MSASSVPVKVSVMDPISNTASGETGTLSGPATPYATTRVDRSGSRTPSTAPGA